MVHYDGTVRNANRHLLQLRYGEDGMDGGYMEFQQLPSIKPSHSTFERRFHFDTTNQRFAIHIVSTYTTVFLCPQPCNGLCKFLMCINWNVNVKHSPFSLCIGNCASTSKMTLFAT